MLLTHVLLQEGRNWHAAEQVLRDVLVLDPTHAEAQRNLAVLLRQQGRLADATAAPPVSLTELYDRACRIPSDINEHCPTLYALAKECRHIIEFGTSTGVSTTALLFAQPEKLVCYDKVKQPEVEVLLALANGTDFVFHQADVLKVDIEPTDLLYIDTWHVYDQLKEEFGLLADKARKSLSEKPRRTISYYRKGEM